MTTASEASLMLADGPRAITVVRRARARTMRLSVDPRDGRVRLSLPPRASLKAGLDWAATKSAWVAGQLARLPAQAPLGDGAVLSVAGVPLTIVHDPARVRGVARIGDRLMVGGGADLFRARTLRWLRAEALRVLTADTRALAAAHGISVGRIAVGDARGRWGSCSASGDIRYSWRLILAPPSVRHAIVAHELAHRLHMNHGPAFHAAARRLTGTDPAPALAWLRAHGAGLHWIGRDPG